MSNELVGLLPIVVPLVGGALSYLAYLADKKAGALMVILFSLAVMLVGGWVIWQGPVTVDFEHHIVWHLDIVEIFDYLLIFLFIGMAIYIRHAVSALLGVIQLGVLGYYDAAIKGGLEGPAATLNIDPIAHVFLMISCFVGSLILIYATRYMEQKEKDPARFFFMMFLFLGGMNAAVMADNLLWLFFFWEITTLCSFVLINHDRTDESLRNAITALWMTLLGGVFLILGVTLIGIQYDTYSMAAMLEEAPIASDVFLFVVLFTLAAFTKSAIYPFQKWLVRAMVAPTPVSALLHSATMVNLGIYLLLRITPTFTDFAEFQVLLALAGGITFLAAAVQAVPQENSKKMLAYSTISNLGLIVMAIGLASTLGYIGAVLLLIFHAFAKAMLFMSVGTVQKTIGSKMFDDMGGLVRRMPTISIMIFVGVLALLALPFGAFVTKWLLLESSVTYPIVVPFLILGTVVSVLFYTQWLGRISTGESGREKKIAPRYTATLMALAVAIIFSSVLIGDVVHYVVEPTVPGFGDGNPLRPVDDFGLDSVTGYFSAMPLFIVLFLALAIPPLLVSRGERRQVKPYSCGQDPPMRFRGHYFKNLLGEGELDLPLTVVGLMITLIMLGVMLV